ncbi:MAG: hypothetical protein E6230_13960 [Paenibacillus dendritiformis]|uniref:hypothetical protein n=1 Tax=uncultured Paenibacillus sp. TaxID=227322 RepID=UPI0025FF7393|nr:hypothetical protein [uncultured Paenibacillus sp.]MDU5143280.1 hypothetical protein [Paenibacillus dendritiformis]
MKEIVCASPIKTPYIELFYDIKTISRKLPCKKYNPFMSTFVWTFMMFFRSGSTMRYVALGYEKWQDSPIRPDGVYWNTLCFAITGGKVMRNGIYF